LDHTDTGDDTSADLILGTPCGNCAQLEEGAVLIEKKFDAFVNRQFVTIAVTLHVLLAPASGRFLLLVLQLCDEFRITCAIRHGSIAGEVKITLQYLHRCSSWLNTDIRKPA